jgi:hypothetical protein
VAVRRGRESRPQPILGQPFGSVLDAPFVRTACAFRGTESAHLQATCYVPSNRDAASQDPRAVSAHAGRADGDTPVPDALVGRRSE